jgi:hypothetical protein
VRAANALIEQDDDKGREHRVPVHTGTQPSSDTDPTLRTLHRTFPLSCRITGAAAGVRKR